MDSITLLKTCLACFNKSYEMHHLQDILTEDLKILEILYKLVPSLMEDHDFSLPEWLCAQCLKHLKIAYRFQKQCLNSIEYLRKLHAGNSLKEEQNAEINKEEDSVGKNEITSGEEVSRYYLNDCSPEEIMSYKGIEINSPKEITNNIKPFEEIVLKQKYSDMIEYNEDLKTFDELEESPDLVSNKKPNRRLYRRTKPPKIQHSRHKKEKSKRIRLKNNNETIENSDLLTDDSNISQHKNEKALEMPLTIKIETANDDVKGHNILTTNNNEEVMATSSSNSCNLCDQTFKTKQGLAMHRSKTHFKKYPYKCDKCNKGFNSEDHYTKHYNRHLGIKTFKCNQCDKAFHANSILNQHLISHSKEAPHLCNICGKSFRRIDSLRQHTKRHSDERPFQCSVCPKRFKCRSDYNNHMVTHETQKRHECEICGVRLASSESLTHHKRVHSGEKPYKCRFCDKSFSCSSNMKSHEKIHTGEKPYKCPYCPKSFRQSTSRVKHLNVHTNERAFKCRFCGKSFNHASNVRSHEKIHTGERPYKCSYCEKTFRESSTRTRHIKNIHQKELNNKKLEVLSEEIKSS